MKPILCCFLLLLPGSLRALGESDAQRRAEEAREGIFTKAQVAFSYDDNVFRLSPDDIAAWRSQNALSAPALQQRFDRMDSLDDGVFDFSGGAYEQAGLFENGFASRWGVDLNYFKYRQNTIKDYPAVKTYARQYFTADHYVEAWFTGIVNRFERNYFGRTQTTRRFPGTYDSRSYGLLLDSRWDVPGGLESALSFVYGQDRYQQPELNYRNNEDRRYEIELGRNFYEWAHARAGYAFEQQRALGSSLMDTSFYAHHWSAGLELTPLPRMGLELGYDGSLTAYTSHLGVTADPFHAGRRDFTDDIKLNISYRLGAYCEILAGYARQDRRSNLPHASSDEFLGYAANSYSLGVRAPLINLAFLKPD